MSLTAMTPEFSTSCRSLSSFPRKRESRAARSQRLLLDPRFRGGDDNLHLEPGSNCHPSGAAIFRQRVGGKIAFFELALLLETLFIRSRLGARVRAILARLFEFLPRGDAVGLKLLHEIPQSGPNHLMGEARIPRNRHAQRQVLVEAEIAR